MNLTELGLKSKPQTKYFDGGYISFQTTNHELSYKITIMTPKIKASINGGKIISTQHLEKIWKIESIQEAIQA